MSWTDGPSADLSVSTMGSELAESLAGSGSLLVELPATVAIYRFRSPPTDTSSWRQSAVSLWPLWTIRSFRRCPWPDGSSARRDSPRRSPYRLGRLHTGHRGFLQRENTIETVWLTTLVAIERDCTHLGLVMGRTVLTSTDSGHTAPAW